MGKYHVNMEYEHSRKKGWFIQRSWGRERAWLFEEKLV